MYYKVHAQNVNVAEPIKEITQEILKEEIVPLVDLAIENELVANAYAAYEIAKAQLEEYEILNCGDYCIVKQDDVPQERPTMCGFDTDIFEG